MKLALVGNQNSGKSTLFNTLTGSNQKIGNWPGVTIEKKSGTIKNTEFDIIDLPGIYSLNPYTREEKVTSDFIYKEQVDIIINVIDCNSISRGLYLTMQLLELNKDIIIALNMHELAEEKGVVINEKKLSELFGEIPVIKISAISGRGCDLLISKINEIDRIKNVKDNKINYNKEKNNKVNDNKKDNAKHYNEAKENLNTEKLTYAEKIKGIENRYKYIDEIAKKVIIYKKFKKQKSIITDKLDKFFLHKFLAIPIFVAIMFAVYYISIELVGSNTIDRINNYINLFSDNLEIWLYKNGISEALISLLINGILKGVSSVISFLPQLMVLFITISFLEKVGYMSRISLIFDKLFRKLGMSGNSVISFILGTSCSVPGIIATKTIKDEREKKITAILTSFIPCSAKLPIISLFATYFFNENAGLVALSFYLLAIVVIVFSALLLKRLDKDFEKNIYISELPEYRLPKIKYVLKDSIERIIDFIKRTGSVILLSSIVVWVLLSFSINLEYGVDIEDSVLADLGKTFSWIFIPMVGKNSWEIGVSAIQGLIAKEQVISSMAIIAGLDTNNISNSIFVAGSPFEFFTPVSAYAYVCFNLFCAPCFGAIGAMKKSLGGTKMMLKAVTYQYVIAYIISCLIYTVGNKFI